MARRRRTMGSLRRCRSRCQWRRTTNGAMGRSRARNDLEEQEEEKEEEEEVEADEEDEE